MLIVARYALLTVALWVLVMEGPAWAWSPTNMFSSGNSASNGKSTKKTGSNRRAASKPGVVDTLTAAPKKLYTNTKSLVAPSKKPAPPARQRSDTWNSYTPKPPSSQKPSGIKGWLAPEPPPQPRTVGEWMQQKRVEP
jgi:hypothetical protein